MKYASLEILTGIVFASILVLAGVALADTTASNFEGPTYSIGTINGQDGWSKTGAYDVAVAANTYSFPSFASQVLRISNAITSGSFGDQTFSKSLINEAGETDAQPTALSGGTRQNHYEATFDIASAMSVEQPGLMMSVSPDRGDGARMAYLRFEDHADGIHIFFNDFEDAAPLGTLATPADGCGTGDDFVDTDIATIDRTPHTIKLTIDFVDGPHNDVVKVYLDSTLIHIGTSWEDYFRWCTESGGGVVNDATADVSRTVDSLLFRTGGTAAPATLGNGFLIDNLNLVSGASPVGPPTTKGECLKNGWKVFDNPTFKNQGQCVAAVVSKSVNH
jgi:hypothetical protein